MLDYGRRAGWHTRAHRRRGRRCRARARGSPRGGRRAGHARGGRRGGRPGRAGRLARRDRRARRGRGRSCATCWTRSTCAAARRSSRPPTSTVPADEATSFGAVRRLRALLDRSALERRARDLESALAALTVGRRRDLDSLRVEMLRRLALAAEYRDDNTREHTERVAALAARLGQRLGLSELAVTHIRHAAPLHDVGKIAIPDSILLKPGRLSARRVRGRQDPRRGGRARARRGRLGAARGRREHRPLPPRALGRHGLSRRARRATTSRSWGGSCTSPTCSTCSSTSARTRTRSASRTPPRRSPAAPARSSTPRWSRRSRDLGARVWLAAPGVYGG